MSRIAFVGVFVLLQLTALGSSFSESKWTLKNLTVNKGDEVTLTCVTSHVSAHDVITISRILDTQELTVCDNEMLRSPFSNLPRFSVEQTYSEHTRTIVISIAGARTEDSAIYGCYRSMDPDSMDIVNVTVKAPVSDIYLATITPDGDEVPSYDGYVMLNEHERLGIGCVATVEGSLVHPSMRVSIDGKEATDLFTLTRETLTATIESGLLIHYTQTRLTHMTSAPNPDFNSKPLDCYALQPGFDRPVTTSATLTIYYSPRVRCMEQRLVARIGDVQSLNCTVQANPGSRIMWLSARHLDPGDNKVFHIREQGVIGDVTYLELLISPTSSAHFHQYTIRADNVIGTNRVTIDLEENTLDRSDSESEEQLSGEAKIPHGQVDDKSEDELEISRNDYEMLNEVTTTHHGLSEEKISEQSTVSVLIEKNRFSNPESNRVDSIDHLSPTTSLPHTQENVISHQSADEYFLSSTSPTVTKIDSEISMTGPDELQIDDIIGEHSTRENSSADENEAIRNGEFTPDMINSERNASTSIQKSQGNVHDALPDISSSQNTSSENSAEQVNIYDVGYIDIIEPHEFEMNEVIYSFEGDGLAITPETTRITTAASSRQEVSEQGRTLEGAGETERSDQHQHGNRSGVAEHDQDWQFSSSSERVNQERKIDHKNENSVGETEEFSGRLNGSQHSRASATKNSSKNSENSKQSNNKKTGDPDTIMEENADEDMNRQSKGSRRKDDQRPRKKDRKEAKEQRRKLKEEERENQEETIKIRPLNDDRQLLLQREIQLTRESRGQKDRSRDTVTEKEMARDVEGVNREREREREWNSRKGIDAGGADFKPSDVDKDDDINDIDVDDAQPVASFARIDKMSQSLPYITLTGLIVIYFFGSRTIF